MSFDSISQGVFLVVYAVSWGGVRRSFGLRAFDTAAFTSKPCHFQARRRYLRSNLSERCHQLAFWRSSGPSSQRVIPVRGEWSRERSLDCRLKLRNSQHPTLHRVEPEMHTIGCLSRSGLSGEDASMSQIVEDAARPWWLTGQPWSITFPVMRRFVWFI